MPFDRKSRADVTRLRDYVTANSPGGEDFTTATDVRLADVMNAPTTSPVARPLVTARDLMIAVGATRTTPRR